MKKYHYEYGCFRCRELYHQSDLLRQTSSTAAGVCPKCRKRATGTSHLPDEAIERLAGIKKDDEIISVDCPCCHKTLPVKRDQLRTEIACTNCFRLITAYGPRHVLHVREPSNPVPYKPKPAYSWKYILPKFSHLANPLITLAFIGALLVAAIVPPLVVGSGLWAFTYLYESRPKDRSFQGVQNGRRIYSTSKRTVDPQQRAARASEDFRLGKRIGFYLSIPLMIMVVTVMVPGMIFFLWILITGIFWFGFAAVGWGNSVSGRFPDLPSWQEMGQTGLIIGFVVGFIIIAPLDLNRLNSKF